MGRTRAEAVSINGLAPTEDELSAARLVLAKCSKEQRRSKVTALGNWLSKNIEAPGEKRRKLLRTNTDTDSIDDGQSARAGTLRESESDAQADPRRRALKQDLERRADIIRWIRGLRKHTSDQIGGNHQIGYTCADCRAQQFIKTRLLETLCLGFEPADRKQRARMVRFLRTKETHPGAMNYLLAHVPLRPNTS